MYKLLFLLFENQHINISTLKERSYNLRWAEVEKGIIPLTAADLDFPCATPIIEAIKSYSNKGYFNYGPTEGMPILKESISSYFKRKRNVTIDPKNILPVDSAAFGIYLTCQSFLQPGDEAIIFDPVDFLFRYSIEKVGATAVSFSIPNISEIDFSMLETLITKKTKMICLCNPLNPTGKVFTKNELTQLAKIANKFDLIILSDEIWSDIIFEPYVFTSIASINEEINNRTIIVTGFSKSYGLAGLRIGAVLTKNNQLYTQLLLNADHQSTIHGINVISQVAASTALNECNDWLNQFLTHLQKMRDLCVEKINNINGFSCQAPQGCYVVFIDIKKTGLSSKEMHAYLLQEAKVSVVPGLQQWFGKGAEGFIRISFATSEAILTTALDNIHHSISKL